MKDKDEKEVKGNRLIYCKLIRFPIGLYEKIRERSYLQRKSMQAIVLEILERELGR